MLFASRRGWLIVLYSAENLYLYSESYLFWHWYRKKKRKFVAEIDASSRAMQEKHLYCPACEYRQILPKDYDTNAFCFAFMYSLLTTAYWGHRIRFKKFLSWERCLATPTC